MTLFHSWSVMCRLYFVIIFIAAIGITFCVISEDFVGSLNENRKIVVYGECLDAYSCIAALLELGIEPKMLTFVEPFPPEDPVALRVNCFNNETVSNNKHTQMA